MDTLDSCKPRFPIFGQIFRLVMAVTILPGLVLICICECVTLHCHIAAGHPFFTLCVLFEETLSLTQSVESWDWTELAI